MARELRCGDVVDGCDGVVDTPDHAAEAHGMQEVDADTAAALQAAIHDA